MTVKMPPAAVLAVRVAASDVLPDRWRVTFTVTPAGAAALPRVSLPFRVTLVPAL